MFFFFKLFKNNKKKKKMYNVQSYQMILGARAVEKKSLKIITFKTLGNTYIYYMNEQTLTLYI